MDVNDEVRDLIKNDLLIQEFDIHPTAFYVSKSLARDWVKFCKRFNEIQTNQGFSHHEKMPAKHCLKN